MRLESLSRGIRRFLGLGVAALGLFALPAQGAPITFTGSGTSLVSGSTLSASVTFDTSGNNLVVTFTNTGTADVLYQADILTAVVFDVAGPTLSLTPGTGSAVLGTGSTVVFDTGSGTAGNGTDTGGVVGGEWNYSAGISSTLSTQSSGALTQNYGISSAGFSVFDGANFPGSNLQGPVAVDGVQYGLDTMADNLSTGQDAQVTGNSALIKDSVVFTIPGLPNGFDPSTAISNVAVQYGTALTTDTGFTVVPEPATISLLGLGGLAMVLRRRRR